MGPVRRHPHDTKTWVAREDVASGGNSDAAGEPAQRGNCLDAAGPIDPVDLSSFAAGPQVALAVERDALGMIQPGREDLEPLDGYDGPRRGHLEPSPAYAVTSISTLICPRQFTIVVRAGYGSLKYSLYSRLYAGQSAESLRYPR